MNQWCAQPVLFDVDLLGVDKTGHAVVSDRNKYKCSIAFNGFGQSSLNCRTLLYMHTRTCMCGALDDLFAAQ